MTTLLLLVDEDEEVAVVVDVTACDDDEDEDDGGRDRLADVPFAFSSSPVPPIVFDRSMEDEGRLATSASVGAAARKEMKLPPLRLIEEAEAQRQQEQLCTGWRADDGRRGGGGGSAAAAAAACNFETLLSILVVLVRRQQRGRRGTWCPNGEYSSGSGGNFWVRHYPQRLVVQLKKRGD
ncbi:hypothetical protein TYRP_017407 [Tyrophagus putrescentiae]|nr:hypothetical protein TYRP_017407 [Tyrophagus putrescentiae]